MPLASRLAAVVLLLRAGPAAAAACAPVAQWIWDGRTQGGGYPQACITPLVVQLSDDNSDGRIDAADGPDVVFVHQSAGAYEAVLTALDGATGAERFTVAAPRLLPTGLVAGDIDGDGWVEIVAFESDHQHLVAFEHDGSFKWRSAPAPRSIYEFDALAVADLDQDGSPELFTGELVWNADGSFRWQGTASQGVEGYWNLIHISNAADLVPANPGLELLAGPTAYAADGSIVWTNAGLPDGFTAAGDLDGDGRGEVVLATVNDLYLLDDTGTQLGAPWTVPGLLLSQPLLADLDADGLPEAIAINSLQVDALKWSGSAWVLLWTSPTDDDTRLNGASSYDFDGDGAADVLYHDSWRWYILDGRSGAKLSTLDFISATTLEVPVVADLDHDCPAEILVSGCQGGIPYPSPNQVIAYECSPSRPARSIWNEYGYHVTNVGDDGSIPRVEAPPWPQPGSWQGQVGGGGPSVQAGPAQAVCAGASVTLDGTGSSGCAAGLEYRWRQGASILCDWSPVPTCAATPAVPATTYTLDVRCVGQPGCEASGDVTIAVSEPPLAAAGPDRSVCENAPVNLSGAGSSDPGCTAGLVFEWRDGPTVVRAAGPSPDWTPPTSAPGIVTYTLAVWCAQGPRCEATDEVVLEVRQCPLHVAFAAFSARPVAGGSVEVRWSTLAESGTMCFEIERGDGRLGPFATLPACVEARGAPADYRFTDAAPGRWYRIVERTGSGRGSMSPAFAVADPAARRRRKPGLPRNDRTAVRPRAGSR